MQYKIERREPRIWRLHFEDYSMKQVEFNGYPSDVGVQNHILAIQKVFKGHEWDGTFCGPFGMEQSLDSQ